MDSGENPLAAVWLRTHERELLGRWLTLIHWPAAEWATVAAIRRKMVGGDDPGDSCVCSACKGER